jgi:hypothetical protein
MVSPDIVKLACDPPPAARPRNVRLC